MNNKYSVACITLVRDKYTVRLHGAPCSSLDGVTACVVTVVYTADSIRKFDSKSNRTADSIRDSIRTQKNDSQVPICDNVYKCFQCKEHLTSEIVLSAVWSDLHCRVVVVVDGDK